MMCCLSNNCAWYWKYQLRHKRKEHILKKRISIFLLCLCLFVGMVASTVPQAHAASEMKTSTDGISYIKSVEGFSKYPYYDYGQYTVGYGTRCPGDKYSYYKEHGITEEEAEDLLRIFLTYTENEINTKLIDKYGLTMTQSQFDALVSFSFNIGTSWLSSSKISTIKTTILNNGTPNEIIYAFSLYCNAGGSILPGLVTRRLCEANMYLNGTYGRTHDEDIGYVYYNANGGNVDYKIQGFLVSEAPAPILDATCDGRTFMGWYTEIVGGTKITSLSSDLIGKTLFAHWDTEEGVDVNKVDPITVKVSGDDVNIRIGPGTNYDILRKANKGDELTITRVIASAGMTWGQFDQGWICLSYTNYDEIIAGNSGGSVESPDKTEQDNEDDETNEDTSEDSTTTETPIAKGTFKVNNSLRIRSGHGTTDSTIGHLYNSDNVDILETKIVNEVTGGRI
jgi:GH24 family phage-related lysozyme (muramidase)